MHGTATAGAVLGLAILGFSCAWSGISTQVGAVVAIALPVRGGGAGRALLACGWGGAPAAFALQSWKVGQLGTRVRSFASQPASHPALAFPSAQTLPQLVSAWANGLGAFFTLLADRYR